MILLGIETSGPVGSVALHDGRRTLASHTFPEGARHARDLMSAVDEIAREAEVDRSDVAAVAVSEGPGSFTGLRIGAACAKTLAYALHWDLVGVPSLEVLAQNVDPDEDFGREPDANHERVCCPTRDARRGCVYGTVFERRDGIWHDTTGVVIGPAEDVADRIPDGALVFGTGVGACPAVFSGPRFRVGSRRLSVGRAAEVARLGLRRLARAGGDDPMRFMPRYYRLTEAEEKARSGEL